MLVQGHFVKWKIDVGCVALILLALAALLFVHQVFALKLVVDDSYISFRYSRNLSLGEGLCYNPGERVEGYTNFLWVLLLGLFHRAGADIVKASDVLGSLAFLLMIPVLCRALPKAHPSAALARFIAPVVFIFSLPALFWARSGMETLFFSFFMILGVVLSSEEEPERPGTLILAGLSLGGAALLRPEGVLAFGVLFLFRTGYVLVKKKNPLPALIRFVSGFLGIFLPHFLWRLSYYGFPFPNTFYAKVSGIEDLGIEGVKYLTSFCMVGGGFLFYAAALFLVFRAPSFRILSWNALLWVYTAYIVSVGGDTMVLHRFFVPILPLMTLFLGEVLWRQGFSREGKPVARAAAFMVFLLFTSLVFWISLRAHLRTIHYYQNANLGRRAVGEWLRENAAPGTSIGEVQAGIIPYVSGLYTLDILGLNDRHIAHTKPTITSHGRIGLAHFKHDASYVLSRKPDYLLFGLRKLMGESAPEIAPPFREVFLNWKGEKGDFTRIPAVYELFTSPGFQRNYAPVYLKLPARDYYVATFRRTGGGGPGESEIQERIGLVEEESGFPAGALEAYRKALEADPGNRSAAEGIARLQAVLKK